MNHELGILNGCPSKASDERCYYKHGNATCVHMDDLGRRRTWTEPTQKLHAL
jgi:hypothetical protein